MKYEELKPYLVGYERQYYVYDATSVEEAIAELKAENERLKKKMDDYHLMSDYRRAKIKELKRALWLARAWMASNKYQMFCFSDHIGDLMNINGFIQRFKGCSNMRNAREWQKIWQNVERKCRAKAEGYR